MYNNEDIGGWIFIGVNVEMHAKIKIVTVMLIFGSIGALVRGIDLSPGEIALLRAAIGSVFLIGTGYFLKRGLPWGSLKKNAWLLGISGAVLGINWILLFQAYECTSIANATLSYYFAPIFVIILAPLILKEKLTPIRVVCVFAALFGLFLIVKVGNGNLDYPYEHIRGIIYGLMAAVFYASVTLLNKCIKNVPGFETTLIQLASAVLVLSPYVAFKGGLNFSSISANSIYLILTIGILHTGIAYFLYFTAIKDIKGQTIAVLSYIDPVSAVIIAAIFLGEGMNLYQIAGGILILGSTFVSEKLETAMQ